MTYIISSPEFDKTPAVDEVDATYVIPPRYDKHGNTLDVKKTDEKLLGWIREAATQGETFIKDQRAFTAYGEGGLDEAIDRIFKSVAEKTDKALSDVWVPITKRAIREDVAILSNMRPSWNYEPNDTTNADWRQTSTVLNACSQDWYYRSFPDRAFKKLLQWGTVQGTGYISSIWKPGVLPYEEGKIVLKTYDYSSVLPVQINKDYDLQEAYAVIIKDEMTLASAHRMFPHKAAQIQADRNAPKTSTNKIVSAVTDFFSLLSGHKSGSNPTVDVMYIYVRDYSLNTSKSEIPMGRDSWAYKVPVVGSQIPDGQNGDGTLRTRKASWRDCFMYPYRRLIIATKSTILYDGPSYWWHGKVPVVKYAPDEWVWSYLGYSMALEVAPLERSANSIRRGIEDGINLALDPPKEMDERYKSTQAAKEISARIPGRTFRTKLSMDGSGIKPVFDASFYAASFNPATHAYVSQVEEKILDILGVPSLRSLQQARQIPSGDSIEKFFAQAGALVTDMSRSLDPVLFEIADFNKHYFMQFYTPDRRIKIVGRDAITRNELQYKPKEYMPVGSLISTNFTKEDYNEIARRHIRNFLTVIEPTSLHEMTHIQQKLMLMQLRKIEPMGVDLQTLVEAMNVKGWGELEGDTGKEKSISEMKLKREFGLESMLLQALLQIKLQGIAQGQTPEGQAASAMQSLASGLAQSMPSGENRGRPPDMEKAPSLVQKDNGTRSTVSTSTE